MPGIGGRVIAHKHTGQQHLLVILADGDKGRVVVFRVFHLHRAGIKMQPWKDGDHEKVFRDLVGPQVRFAPVFLLFSQIGFIERMEILCERKTVKGHVLIGIQCGEHGVDHIPGAQLSAVNSQPEIIDPVDLPADKPHEGRNELDAPFLEIRDQLCNGEFFAFFQ